MPLTVSAMIASATRQSPDSTAIAYDGGVGRSTVTWRMLDDIGWRTARGLAELGIGAQDRVALWLPNTPAWLALFIGCARLGAIAVTVNTRFRSHEVADIIGRTGATALALWPGFRDIDFLKIIAEADKAAFGTLETVIIHDEGGGGGLTVPPPALAQCRMVDFDDLAASPPLDQDRSTPGSGCAIFTTSGTTSAPKFVLHTQAGVVSHATDVARDSGLRTSGGGALQALPLCGVFGFSQAMATLAAGCPMTLTPSFDAGQAAALVREREITHINATDEMYRDMLDARTEAQPFPSLRLAGYAAFGAEADDIVADAERRGLRLTGLYGMSEIQALYARQKPDDDAALRKFAGGWPVSPHAAVRVRDPDTGRLLGDGEAGELEACGPSLMAGYFGDDGATAETVTDDGYVRTGDLAHTLPNGSFVFHARMNDALRLGGFLVNPAEIEDFILRRPEITGCQVVGVEHQGRTRPFAFVTLDSGAEFDPAALTNHCRAALAGFKVPAGYEALDNFPVTRSPNGTKVQRARLREMAERLMDG